MEERYKLYNGDCLDVMDKLITEGIKVDTIIIDPPYELDNHGKGKNDFKDRQLVKDNHIEYMSNGFDYENVFEKMLKLQHRANILIFCSNKQVSKIMTYFENKKNHVWQKNGIVETISGKTVLILGVGDIGRTTAKKLKALGAKEIFGVRRNSKEDFVENFNEIFDIVELDFLLPKADIVICCLPETEATIGVLNEEMLSLMKENAVLVNVGRGSLIVTNDLIKILKQNKIKGVVLDVFENEPLPENSELWDMKNVIITPHIAGPSFSGDEATKDKIWKICFENIERYLQGGKLRNVVDFNRGY